MGEDLPYAPSSPLFHDPMDETSDHIPASPMAEEFQYAPFLPPPQDPSFDEDLYHSSPTNGQRAFNPCGDGGDTRAHNSDNHIDDHDDRNDAMPHAGNDHDDTASRAGDHMRSARVTRAYHTLINGMFSFFY
jgi:hypothetical protein